MFLKKSRPFSKVPVVHCKICGCATDFFDAVDFSQNCLRFPLPLAGLQVPYFRCGNCQFLFTNLCDSWTQAEFEQKIYNDEYVQIDPEFVSVRPLEQAEHFSRLIASRKGAVRFLDYGGGTGVFARRMNELGFDTASCDPFHHGALAPAENERFELIHCREVLEHACDPQAFVVDMVRRMSDEAVVYLSTATQPPDILETRLGWWYAGPRNGHISLFSYQSLAMLWNEHGFEFRSFNGFIHLAWRGQPASLSCLLEGSGRNFQAREL